MHITHDRNPGYPRQVRPISISTGWRINPAARDLVWFEKLHRHGPQNTRFLHTYTQREHPRLSRAVERLKLLAREDDSTYRGTTLYKPPQQFTGLIAPRSKYLVYDLNRRGEEALKKTGSFFDHTPVTSGSTWKHDYLASCVSASLELATLRDATYSFLFQDEIASARMVNAATKRIEFPVGDTKLRPDRLMGIEHNQRHTNILLSLEVDMATEPLRSTNNQHRKALWRNLLQWETFIGKGQYQRYFGKSARMLLLYVFSNERRMHHVMPMLGSARWACFRYVPHFNESFRPPLPLYNLFDQPWLRAGFAPIALPALF